jgi:hypothetical protein
MTEEEWLTTDDLIALLNYVRRQRRGKAVRERRLRLLGCAWMRQQELPDDRLLDYLVIAERFADGEIDAEDALRSQRALANTFFHWLKALEVERCFHLLSPTPGDAMRSYPPRRNERSFCDLLRDIFGNPFRPVAFNPAWRTDTAVALARQMYESRDFGAMPVLADALQDAGCDNEPILSHCRDATLTHVRGCWVVDLVLGKA